MRQPCMGGHGNTPDGTPVAGLRIRQHIAHFAPELTRLGIIENIDGSGAPQKILQLPASMRNRGRKTFQTQDGCRIPAKFAIKETPRHRWRQMGGRGNLLA
ncbi:hypothetical protein BCBD1442_00790 [Brucella ceti]|nr:hypothetical protein BCBD1442_00790 [Brucella ceti]